MKFYKFYLCRYGVPLAIGQRAIETVRDGSLKRTRIGDTSSRIPPPPIQQAKRPPFFGGGASSSPPTSLWLKRGERAWEGSDGWLEGERREGEETGSTW